MNQLRPALAPSCAHIVDAHPRGSVRLGPPGPRTHTHAHASAHKFGKRLYVCRATAGTAKANHVGDNTDMALSVRRAKVEADDRPDSGRIYCCRPFPSLCRCAGVCTLAFWLSRFASGTQRKCAGKLKLKSNWQPSYAEC